MSKVSISSEAEGIVKSFELIGELGIEIARICSPNTHELMNLALYYDACLPEEPKTITVTVDNKPESVTVQRGDIVNSLRLKGIITRSYWFEFNRTMREKLPELKMMMLAAAIERSLKVEERREITKREKEINKFLKDTYDLSLKKILVVIDEAKEDED